MSETRNILVVANETLAGDELIDAVKRHADLGPVRAIVIAPVNEPAAGYVVYQDSRRAAAGRRLDRTVDALRAAGIPAHGAVIDCVSPRRRQRRPRPGAGRRADRLDPSRREIRLAAAQPHRRNPENRRDRARSSTSSPMWRPAQASRTCSWSPTRRSSESRCSTASGHAAKAGPASFLLISPQSDPTGRPSILTRSEGCERRCPNCGARASRRTGRSPTPIRTRRRCRRFTTSGSTRLSSRPSRESGPAGYDATSSDASVATPVFRSITSRSSLPRRGAGMSAHAEAALHGDHDHHGPPAANRSSRIEPTILGMFLFIGSEAMLFGAFFAAYFFVRVVNPSASDVWPPRAVRVPEVRRRRQHRDARHLELHDALGVAVDQAQQPARAAGGARADDPDGLGVPAHPGDRVRARGLQHE